jgi:serine phosphatase RsbU (regulator of sigma subunit)/anti-sigma regulatory factor (Ser/Thr protein kinase)
MNLRKTMLPTAVFIMGVVVVLVGPAKTVPPSAPMVAALVAAGLCDVATTSIFIAVSFVTSVLLTRYSSGYTGDELLGRGAFQVGLAVVAVALLSIRLRHEGTIRSQNALVQLQDVSDALAATHELDEISAIASRRCTAFLGARVGWLLVESAGSLLPAAPGSGANGGPALPSDFPSMRPSEVAAAARRLTVWSDTQDFLASFPEWREVVRDHRAQSFAAMVLSGADGLLGVFFVMYAGRQSFDSQQRAMLKEMSGRIARAVEHARVSASNRSIATELQKSLLGPTVFLTEVGHCSRYVPAESTLSVGGDWYQTSRLGDGKVGIAVGDAIGHGLGAAAVMGQLRSALAACALGATNAGEALDTLDEFASDLPGAEATTVVYAIVDLFEGWIEYSCAGHPPPLYVSPTGEVEFLEGGRALPLACKLSGTSRPSARAPFPAGSTVIMYTDGLIERRGESLNVGFDRIREAVGARWSDPIELLADELTEVLLTGSARTDDVALLVLRSPVSSPHLFLTKLPAHPAQLTELRLRFREWLNPLGLDEAEKMTLITAVNEACANAVEHAYSDEHNPLMRVEAAVVGREMVISVTDTGTWKRPDARTERGRGITIMRELMDHLEINKRPSGTSVTIRHTLRVSERRPSLSHPSS